MAPLRDAMSFVDGDPGELSLTVYHLQPVAEPLLGTQLRGDIEQPCERVARLQILVYPILLRIGSEAVETACVDVCSLECLYLVYLGDRELAVPSGQSTVGQGGRRYHQAE